MPVWTRKFLFAATMLLAFVMAAACTSTPTAPDASPSWLTALIAQLEAEPPANPPALIARYDYKGQSVYFLPQRCCDQMSVLYRADGTVICHPDGGITGAGDRRCPDFFAQRLQEHIVWRDARTRVGY
jgi:hypothetical protein